MTTVLAPPDLSTLVDDMLTNGPDSGPMLRIGSTDFEGVEVKGRTSTECTFSGSPPHALIVTAGDLVYGRSADGEEYLSEWDGTPLALDPAAGPLNPQAVNTLTVTFVEMRHRLPDL
jgi:hypothetical protein